MDNSFFFFFFCALAFFFFNTISSLHVRTVPRKEKHLAGFPYEEKKKILGWGLDLLVVFPPHPPPPPWSFPAHTQARSHIKERLTPASHRPKARHAGCCQVRSDGLFTSDVCVLWRTGIRTGFSFSGIFPVMFRAEDTLVMLVLGCLCVRISPATLETVRCTNIMGFKQPVKNWASTLGSFTNLNSTVGPLKN